MSLSARSLRWAALVTGVVVAMAAVAAESARSQAPTRSIGVQIATPVRPATSVFRVTTPGTSKLVAPTTTVPGPPTCQPPPLPQATFPTASSSASYGIPFVAHLFGGDILSGWDESIAAQPPPHPPGWNPWRADLSNIEGYAAGLLTVPSLQAKVTQLIFCYQGILPSQTGGKGGIGLALRSPPGATTTNAVGDCKHPVHPGFTFQDDRITIIPDPNTPTTLSVTGVEPDGSLDLTGTQSAFTEIDNYQSCPPGPVPTQICTQFGPTLLTFGTRLPPPPPTAPPNVSYPHSPQPLSGVINQSTAILATTNFGVLAFKEPPTTGGCGLAFALNASLAGFDSTGLTRYKVQTPQVQNAGDPGWSEFSTSTQIVQLGG